MLIVFFLAYKGTTRSEELDLPMRSGDSVVGKLRYTIPKTDETLLDIARNFDLGYDQIVAANPTLNRWVPAITEDVVLPSRYILPDTPREGIVINLAELRLYYYPPNRTVVLTYPISTGKMNWKTPAGKTSIVRKEKDPQWNPPLSIRREREQEGDLLPEFIPGGAETNPMGTFALRLGVKGYSIHGTDSAHAFGIGMRVTHGCIRMYPEDVAELYSKVSVGTLVYIIDQPVKVGWRDGTLFLEVHRPIDSEDHEESAEHSLADVRALVGGYAQGRLEIDQDALRRIYTAADGVPRSVGRVKQQH